MGLLDKLFGGKQTAEPAPPRQEDVADLLSKANACIDKGDFAEAARILENVKRVQPQRVSARVNYAYCLLNLDRRLQAQDELQACLELEPKNIDALYMLSGLQAEDQDWLSVSRHLQTLLQVKPDFAFAYPDLAKALFHLGEYTQALDISNAGLKQQPQDMALLLGKGNIHFARYDLDEAMACFDEVLKQQPDNLQAIHNKALVFDRLDQPQKALEFSEQAYTKTPSDLAFLSTYARCLVRVGRVEEGRFLVDQGLGKYPANPDLLLSAATYYDIEGNHEEAIIYLDRLLSKNPRHLEALQHKNLALYSLRSYQAAVACARKAIEYHPNAAICWNLLGSSLHKQGYMEEAESAY
ncbi:MAG: hypothetical protein RLZZ271_1654, partial [Pseudomonadota bacterium]